MIKGGKGGANTKTGLEFEGKTDLSTFLSEQQGYTVKGEEVYYLGKVVAKVFKKRELYRFLKNYNIEWESVLSRPLYPDNCLFVIIKNTLYVIECKTQMVAGSVDEKLQTCDFKKKQYQKLLSLANIDVEYMYILNNYFKHDKYKDVRDYIISVGCQYYFEYIPLTKLGLPVPSEE